MNSETALFISRHADEDVRSLALGRCPEGVDMREALVQISGHQSAMDKLPSWAAVDGILWPEHLSLEQCTSQYVALYKAGLVDTILPKGFTMCDLTGGMGVDCFYLSRSAAAVRYNDVNPQLCDLASHNFPLLGRCNVTISNMTAEEFLRTHSRDHFDLIYVDPARRSNSGDKVVSVSGCQPDVTMLEAQMLRIAGLVMVKLSPMLDISRALSDLRYVSQLWIISFDGECKEMLAVIKDGFVGNTEICSVNIAADGIAGEPLCSTLAEESQLSLPLVSDASVTAGCFLYEPYAAQMKCALYRTLCLRYRVCQLHPASHLYLSKERVLAFPGRQFVIDEVIPFDNRSAKTFFTRTDRANITVRNFPLSSSQLRQRFRVRDGGDRYVFATTLSSGKKVLISTVKIKDL